MSGDYCPHQWIVIEIIPHPGFEKSVRHFRVFASWVGGYTQGDSWRMNSGITHVEQDENFFYFYGSTGSVYHCNKKAYGISSYAYGVLTDMKNKSEGLDVEILEADTDFMNLRYEKL